MKKEKKKYNNGTSFNFISNLGESLGERLTALNELVFGVIESKPYTLKWSEIIKEYNKYKEIHGTVNIDEFSFNYVLGYSLLNNIMQDEPLKEAMYLHLRAELLAKDVNCEL